MPVTKKTNATKQKKKRLTTADQGKQMLFIIRILHENVISSSPATLPGILQDTLRNEKSKIKFQMIKKIL